MRRSANGFAYSLLNKGWRNLHTWWLLFQHCAVVVVVAVFCFAFVIILLYWLFDFSLFGSVKLSLFSTNKKQTIYNYYKPHYKQIRIEFSDNLNHYQNE